MKKILFFIALFFTGFAVNAQYAWVSQATGLPDVSSGVRNVSAVDANVVWIATYDGSAGAANRTNYSRTVDGGVTWVAGTTPAPATFNWAMIDAHNADTAWALYYNGVANAGGGLYFTGNGGATWTQQGAGTIYNNTSFPDIVYFWDGLKGVTMGDPNAAEFEIYTTVDAGNTWTVVPGADIPDPVTGEFGIVDHFSVVGNTIWFDTNKGRVYKSTDFGLTWTVASTGITVPTNDAISICFYDANNGLARLYDNAGGTNIMKVTNDGGTTWTAATPTGNFFGSDVAYIPGTASRLISTGAATGFIGSSFSEDGGLTWVDFETSAQRTAIGAIDTNNIWAGGFTTSPSSDGIFKYTYVPPVLCNDPNISAGVTTASATIVCPGDTLIVSSSGVFSPNTGGGTISGVSWVISNADISGNSDPLNDPSVKVVYNFNFPAPLTSTRQFVNDGTLLGNGTNPYGVYYWTPVVFGNAVIFNTPPVFLSDLTLDNACTTTGTSVMVDVNDGSSPLCAVGIANLAKNVLRVKGTFADAQNLLLSINCGANARSLVKIIDMTGRMIYAETHELSNGVNKLTIDAKNFSSGLYLVQIETANLKAVSKIVKQ